MILCLLCSQEFVQITNSHMKHKHSLSIAEYRSMFPTAALQDDSIIMKGEKNPFYGKSHAKETIELLSSYRLGQTLSSETKEKISKAICDPDGAHHKIMSSSSYRKKMSRSLDAYWESDDSIEHRKKNSLELARRRKSYNDKLKHVWKNSNYRASVSQRMSKEWESMPLDKREIRIKNNRLSYFRHGRGTTISLGEQRLYEILKERFSDVVQHKWIKNGDEVWCIDMYLPHIDTHVQFDGVYWHGLDRKLEEIEESAKKSDIDRSILKAYKRDLRQNEWFMKAGRRLVRISDVDFSLNPDACVQKILGGDV